MSTRPRINFNGVNGVFTRGSSRRSLLIRRNMATNLADSSFLSPKVITAVSLGLVAGGASIYYVANQRRYDGKSFVLRSDSFRPFSTDSKKSNDDKSENKSEPKDSSENQDDTKDQSWASKFNEKFNEKFRSMLPPWAQEVPAQAEKLRNELSLEPGTLADEMWQETHDPEIHPEIMKDASVRISRELCDQEKDFLKNRRKHTKRALAKYLEIPEDEINEEDVPTIAICGSGGGLRAMVAGSASYLSTKEVGLFDCATYTAGVSGSCWLQTLYYSSIAKQNHGTLIQHLKDRIGVHIAYPPPLLRMLTSEPTNKFLLSGGFEKWQGVEKATFGLVDVYGVLLGARLLVPKGEVDVDYKNLKISHQTRYLESGEHPLPIYTSVRHEIPNESEMEGKTEQEKEEARKEAWFQWFEETPYEMWCEELQAGIPSWSVGRKFENGENVRRQNGLSLPETRTPLLMGIWGSAFCATLSHYYHEIRPLVLSFTGFGGLDQLIEEKNEDLVKVHPIDPAQIPNYAIGLKDKLPDSCPESLHHDDILQLMDAGMSNNLPIYPLLRPGRDVDMIIVFDASADIKEENWLRVADGYARQRGIRGWPVGTGFPESSSSSGDSVEQTEQAVEEAQHTSAQQASEKVQQASAEQDAKHNKSAGDDAPPSHLSENKNVKEESELGYCTIWVGTMEERVSDEEPPESKRVEEDWQLMEPDAGIAVAYFPFMANERVEGVDPQTSDFLSTWNFIYTPENIDKVVELARANFEEGKEKTKMAVRAIYERKKKHRLEGSGKGKE